MEPARPRPLVRDTLVALGLALLLGIAWTIRDRAQLAVLRLPDTDDVMRLQQIRDWLGGQPYTDLFQHRLGPPPGLVMHWSRVADLVPAAVILALTPLLGAQTATIAAVIVSPLLLFAAALALIATIARALGTSGPVAAILAALAYPATTIFLPGRIDHHALQMVLLLALVRACMGSGSLRSGAVAGAATALSLAIGMETAPLLAIGGAALAIGWWRDTAGAQARMAGYATALTLVLAAESVLFRSNGWAYPACDGFTATLWRAAQIVALVPAALALAGFATRARGPRLAVLLVAGGAAGALALWVSPGCLSPYEKVDPLLARLWLAHVAEAQPLFRAPAWHGIAYAGLLSVGLATGGWMVWRRRSADWAVLFAVQLSAFAITLLQLRGAYAGALLAAPALAAAIDAARHRGPLPLALAWFASAGILYPFIGDAMMPPSAKAKTTAATPACTAPAGIARIAALPPGTVVAPIDLGAYVLAASRHRVLAAPYHRNTQGNRAMYELFLSPPTQAEALARRWGVDYVAICPDSFDELGPTGSDPHRLAGALRSGHIPAWLRPLSPAGTVPRVFTLTQPARRTTQ